MSEQELAKQIKELGQRLDKSERDISSLEGKVTQLETGKADKHHSHPQYIPLSERRM